MGTRPAGVKRKHYEVECDRLEEEKKTIKLEEKMKELEERIHMLLVDIIPPIPREGDSFLKKNFRKYYPLPPYRLTKKYI